MRDQEPSEAGTVRGSVGVRCPRVEQRTCRFEGQAHAVLAQLRHERPRRPARRTRTLRQLHRERCEERHRPAAAAGVRTTWAASSSAQLAHDARCHGMALRYEQGVRLEGERRVDAARKARSRSTARATYAAQELGAPALGERATPQQHGIISLIDSHLVKHGQCATDDVLGRRLAQHHEWVVCECAHARSPVLKGGEDVGLA